MSCKCIEEWGKQLLARPEKAKLELTFNIKGDVYPYMSAVYEKKSGRGVRKMHLTIIPNFCPFCGKRYHRERKATRA